MPKEFWYGLLASGALLYGVFKILLPALKLAPWRRMLNRAGLARYNRKPEISDRRLEKAMERYPEVPEVYLEFFHYYSRLADLKRRFEALQQGYEKCRHPEIALFLGACWLEEGLPAEALRYLEQEGCRKILLGKRTPLIAQAFYEGGDYPRAREEYLAFYRQVYGRDLPEEEILGFLSPDELSLYGLILKAQGLGWREAMKVIPQDSMHRDMSWKSHLALLKEQQAGLIPAESGIRGSPEAFNLRRRRYLEERIGLVKEFLTPKR